MAGACFGQDRGHRHDALHGSSGECLSGRPRAGWACTRGRTGAFPEPAHGRTIATRWRELDAFGLLYPCTCSRRDIAEAADPNASRSRRPAALSRHLPRDVAPSAQANKEAHARLAPRHGEGVRAWCGHRWPSPNLAGANRQHRGRSRGLGRCHLARRDIATSYHIAVVVDDALQGITHVVRGRDLFAATSIHRLLQELLGSAGAALPTPRIDRR